MNAPLFERDDTHLQPTALTAGPWDPQHCHGGAISALLAELVDGVPTLVPMQPARLSVELLRPVSRAPLTFTRQVLREGKRVQVVRAALFDATGTELAQATALRIRIASLEASSTTSRTPPPIATTSGPDELPRFSGDGVWQAGFFEAVDLRIPEGSLGQPGPAAAWIKLLAPVVEGQEPTPLARVAAAADFGNGISAPLPMRDFVFINPDLNIHLRQLPEDAWIGLDAASVTTKLGIGLTSSTLTDLSSEIGTAQQSLYVEAR